MSLKCTRNHARFLGGHYVHKYTNTNTNANANTNINTSENRAHA
jgi:hypothetical protein